MTARRRTPLVAGAAMVAAVAVLVTLAPLVAPHGPFEADDSRRLEGPSADHPLGTDNLGRCVLSRVLFGGRLSLLLTIAVVLAAGAAGVLLGTSAGYAGRAADLTFVGVSDLLLALPRLVLALVVAGLLGPSAGAVVLVVGLVDWTGYARVARAVVVREKTKPHVLAERALGLTRRRILLATLLPAAAAPVVSYAALRLGRVFLIVAGLGFLGLGVPPPTPEWGAMIAEGRPFLRVAPWMVLCPGGFMVLTVLGFSLLGDGVRRALGAGDEVRS